MTEATNPEPEPTASPSDTSWAAPILRWFDHSHLPPHLAEVADHIRNAAVAMFEKLPESPELAAGLRKLLEAKDCFVRAAIDLYENKTSG